MTELRTVGPFIMDKTLGEGATGRVKLGYHKDNGLKVAIKIVRKGILENVQVLHKLEREIASLRILDHPHVLKLYEVFENSSYLFLVTEFAPGGELFDYIVKRGTMDNGDVLRLFQMLIDGVDYCHAHCICHRDLKPENLLLDSNFQLKIADFGMATAMKEGSLLSSSCGSPHYACPEVVKGINYDGRAADTWSCGIILFALATGRLPFDDDTNNIRVVLRKVKEGEYHFPPFVPKDIKDLIQKILVIDPEKRIDIRGIKAHPWFQSNLATVYCQPYVDICDEGPAISPKNVDSEIVMTLESLGLGTHDSITQCLQSSKKNQPRAFYRVLLYRKHNPLSSFPIPPTPGLRSRSLSTGEAPDSQQSPSGVSTYTGALKVDNTETLSTSALPSPSPSTMIKVPPFPEVHHSASPSIFEPISPALAIQNTPAIPDSPFIPPAAPTPLRLSAPLPSIPNHQIKHARNPVTTQPVSAYSSAPTPRRRLLLSNIPPAHFSSFNAPTPLSNSNHPFVGTSILPPLGPASPPSFLSAAVHFHTQVPGQNQLYNSQQPSSGSITPTSTLSPPSNNTPNLTSPGFSNPFLLNPDSPLHTQGSPRQSPQHIHLPAPVRNNSPINTVMLHPLSPTITPSPPPQPLSPVRTIKRSRAEREHVASDSPILATSPAHRSFVSSIFQNGTRKPSHMQFLSNKRTLDIIAELERYLESLGVKCTVSSSEMMTGKYSTLEGTSSVDFVVEIVKPPASTSPDLPSSSSSTSTTASSSSSSSSSSSPSSTSTSTSPSATTANPGSLTPPPSPSHRPTSPRASTPRSTPVTTHRACPPGTTQVFFRYVSGDYGLYSDLCSVLLKEVDLWEH
ncbi:CAMK/CAMKL/BRSK protein kinase [Pelomyxa schiedti]|nr:CAMK/CAMKL/BRSK protein kinase [Pelomyxa schiedti]